MMSDPENQRRTWLRFVVRLSWVACCIALLTAITLIGSHYLSNRRLMILTKPVNPRDVDPVVGWQRMGSLSVGNWIGTETDIALFFRPVDFLVQGSEIKDARILEILQASSGLKKIYIHNRDLPQGALQEIEARHDPELIHIRTPMLSPEDAACLAKMKSLKYVTIGQFERESRENDWSWLKTLPALETLDVTLWGASPADVVALSHSTAARNISLSGDGVTDENLLAFCDATQLQCLDVEGTGVRLHFGGGKQLPPTLSSLDLRWTTIDDKSMEAVAGLPNLKRISIAGGGLTDTGISTIAQLPAITQLWLDSLPKLTDEDLKPLAQNTSLTEIHVARCGTTPNALVHLNAIPNWTEIRFDDVTFHRAVGAAKPVITSDNAVEILAQQHEAEKMRNNVSNGPLPFPRSPG